MSFLRVFWQTGCGALQPQSCAWPIAGQANAKQRIAGKIILNMETPLLELGSELSLAVPMESVNSIESRQK